MIKGMTGFGSSPITFGKHKGIVEIKSLNHRYLDINFYLPIGFSSLENKIRDIILKKIERGKVSISLKITNKFPESPDINKDILKKYLKCFNLLKNEFGFSDNLKFSDLINLPGVIALKETTISPEDLWKTIEKGIYRSLSDLKYMRSSEGKSLFLDILDKLKRMLLELKNIQSRLGSILKEKRRILSKEEFSSFQKGCDVNEEISRLGHYISEFKALLKLDIAAGKKLDFIAQEMQRETNTIGSKLQDNIVSNSVISLKSKIEKIREQSQNIE